MKKEPYLKPEIESEDIEPGTLLAKGSPPAGNIIIPPPDKQDWYGDGYHLSKLLKHFP